MAPETGRPDRLRMARVTAFNEAGARWPRKRRYSTPPIRMSPFLQ